MLKTFPVMMVLCMHMLYAFLPLAENNAGIIDTGLVLVIVSVV